MFHLRRKGRWKVNLRLTELTELMNRKLGGLGREEDKVKSMSRR